VFESCRLASSVFASELGKVSYTFVDALNGAHVFVSKEAPKQESDAKNNRVLCNLVRLGIVGFREE
jgi:hypothetical protein